MLTHFDILHIKIPAYGLCMAMAFLVAIGLTIYRSKSRGVSLENILIVDTMILAFALIGAKLLYVVVTYNMNDIVSYILKLDFSFLTESGFVYIGGVLAGIIGAIIGVKIAGDRLYRYEDVIVPVIPIIHSIGRIGCLLAGCCHGIEYDGIGAVYYYKMQGSKVGITGYFPIQLVEIACNVIIAVVLIKKARNKHRRYELLIMYMGIYCFCRFIIEFLRGDYVRGNFGILSTSQWICATILTCIFVYIVIIKNRQRSR